MQLPWPQGQFSNYLLDTKLCQKINDDFQLSAANVRWSTN